MPIYTGIADANGDFNISFGQNHRSGEKVTITAEKDAAIKSIELYAPSDVVGGGAIQFSGDFSDFPRSIGNVTITDEIKVLPENAFNAEKSFFGYATGLAIQSPALVIKSGCFRGWVSAQSVIMSDTIEVIENLGLYELIRCTNIHISAKLHTIGAEGLTELKVSQLTLPASLLIVEAYGLSGLVSCDEIICNAVTPPSIQATTFNRLKSTCVFKVPAASVAAYQAAPNWSAFASRIQAI